MNIPYGEYFSFSNTVIIVNIFKYSLMICKLVFLYLMIRIYFLAYKDEVNAKSYAIKSSVFFILFFFFRYNAQNAGALKFITGSLDYYLYLLYGFSALACLLVFIYYFIRTLFLMIREKKS